jgi:hypothetical protein
VRRVLARQFSAVAVRLLWNMAIGDGPCSNADTGRK